jgi:ankyrin repeat protein
MDDEPTATEEQLIAIAQGALELAREGDDVRLAANVDAGVPVDLTDADGNTLLMLAASHGHAAAVRELAVRGADVNRLNDRDQTPLTGAVTKGESDVVAVLVEYGADPDLGTPSARDSAAKLGRPELFG